MLRYTGGKKVKKGTYWNLQDNSRVDIDQEGMLPGDSKAVYYRLPSGLLILSGPVIGLLYVIALPIISIITVVTLGGSKLVGSLYHGIRSLATFGWKPSEAYLAGKKKKKKNKK